MAGVRRRNDQTGVEHGLIVWMLTMVRTLLVACSSFGNAGAA